MTVSQAQRDRPIRVQRRRDLRESIDVCDGKQRWVVKDPISMSYHQMGREEHFLFERLDGNTSFGELQAAFETQFAPSKVSLLEIESLLGVFHRKGLLVVDGASQGSTLLTRRNEKRRRKLWAKLGGILAFRFRGVDPDRWLSATYPYIAWLFSAWAFALSLALMVSALFLAVVRFGELQTKLPELSSFFAADNLFLIALAMMLVKVLHELGHAYACKHVGGECHEIGVILLVFTPTLYCDVSDTWLIGNKWRRAAVAAAGIYVELVLASLAFFLWWSSEPGVFNSLCLNVVMICSVSSILINGNPLLRYDGYFVFSDLLEVPNLWQVSRECLNAWLVKVGLGFDSNGAPAETASRTGWLITYAIASSVYRVMVVTAILFTVHMVLKPLGLSVLTMLIAGFVIVTMLVGPINRFVQFWRNPSNRRRIRPTRASASLAAIAVAVAVIAFVPLPGRVSAPAILEPHGAQQFYAEENGRLVWTVREGDAVGPGDTIAILENPEARRELAALQGEQRRLETRLENLLALQSEDQESSSAIPATTEALKDVRQRVLLQEDRLSRLTIKANLAGQVLSSPEKPSQETPDELPTWSGSLLEPFNLGCQAERGDTICVVGEPGRFSAVLYIEQGAMERLQIGQQVRLDFDRLGVLAGRVHSISRADVQAAPPQLRRSLAIDVAADGSLQPKDTIYQVRVALDQPQAADLVSGASGRGKVLIAGESLGRRWLRAVRRTFAFEL